MTGAVLPDGTDTVVRYEDLEIFAGTAKVKAEVVKKGQNIHRQAADAKMGNVLIEPQIVLSPAEIAVLASVGLGNVDVYSLPSTAIVASGDELVEIDSQPEPHQIRRSNTYAVYAAMRLMHWPATQYHLPDRKDFLLASLETILANHDVIILSGGVSKGQFDYIPAAWRDRRNEIISPGQSKARKTFLVWRVIERENCFCVAGQSGVNFYVLLPIH
jgi:molybdopterin molybdotransferase